MMMVETKSRVQSGAPNDGYGSIPAGRSRFLAELDFEPKTTRLPTLMLSRPGLASEAQMFDQADDKQANSPLISIRFPS
jgi:hypothetical protein